MGRINAGSHSIPLDEHQRVICPWPKNNAPKGLKKVEYKASDATYLCNCGHLHKITEFPELKTNVIEASQIHRRG